MIPARPYVGVIFKCCNVYARVYLNAQKTAYAGNCPRCAARLELKTSPTGSPSRFWSVE